MNLELTRPGDRTHASALELTDALLSLVAAFEHQRALTRYEVIAFTCMQPDQLVNLGWLRRETCPIHGVLLLPAGVVEDELNGGTMLSNPSPQPQPCSDPPDAPTASAGSSEVCASVTPAPAPALAGAALTRADQVMELGRMREALTIMTEEIKTGWQLVVARQQELGWPDLRHVENETFHLCRVASDLHNTLVEAQTKLAWATWGVRKK